MTTRDEEKHVSIAETCTTINSTGDDAGKGGEEGEKKEKVKEGENKRRHRRTFAELDRKFYCTFPDCNRPYATEHSLQQHIRLKHANSPSNSPFAQRRNRAISMPSRQASLNANESYNMYRGEGQAQATDRRVRAPTLTTSHSHNYSPQLSRSAMRPRNNTTSSTSIAAAHSPNMGRSSPYQFKGNYTAATSPNTLGASLAEQHHLNVASDGIQRNVSAPHLPNVDMMMLNVQQNSTPPTVRGNYHDLNTYHSQSSLPGQSVVGSQGNLTSQPNLAATYLGLQMQRPMVGGKLKHSMSYANSSPSESMLNALMPSNDFQGMAGTYDAGPMSYNSLVDANNNNRNMLNPHTTNRTSHGSYNNLGLLDGTGLASPGLTSSNSYNSNGLPSTDNISSSGNLESYIGRIDIKHEQVSPHSHPSLSTATGQCGMSSLNGNADNSHAQQQGMDSYASLSVNGNGDGNGKDNRVEALGSRLSGLGLSAEMTLQEFANQQYNSFTSGGDSMSNGPNMFMNAGVLSDLKYGTVSGLGPGQGQRSYADGRSLGGGEFNTTTGNGTNGMGSSGSLADMQQQLRAQQVLSQQNQQLELQQRQRQRQQQILQQQLERQELGLNENNNSNPANGGRGYNSADALAVASSYAELNNTQHAGEDMKSDSLLDFMNELKKTMK